MLDSLATREAKEHMRNIAGADELYSISPSAADIGRGVLRLFSNLGLQGLTEMTLANGRRADVAAICKKGRISIVEIKSSVADFRSDQKWPDYQPFCDQFYFAVSNNFPMDLIPVEAGLIIADQFGGAIIRDAPQAPLNAARRKAVILRFARLAAQRLTSIHDPQLDERSPPV